MPFEHSSQLSLPPDQDARSGSDSDRWLALDVFRALAVLWMIQGHIFTALLSPSLYRGAWVQPYSLLHGLTAPMFLVGAGLSYGVVRLGSGSADAQRERERARRIVRRAVLLLALGTLLQLPRTSLVEVFTRRDLFIGSFQPGALQLVASGLLLAEGLRRAFRTRLSFAIVATIAALAIAFSAPWLWNLRLSSKLALGSWFDGQAGAQFPLSPWLCFFFLGAAIASVFGRSLWQREARARSWMPAVGILALVCSAACYGLFLAGVRLTSLYGAHAFWYSNPLFVAFRAGLALAWLGVLTASEGFLVRAFELLPKCARVVRALAKHSLVAYVVHLILLYGTPWNPGLARAGASSGVIETCAIFSGVLGVTLIVTLAWARWFARATQRLASVTFVR
jgi:hypothetical protein